MAVSKFSSTQPLGLLPGCLRARSAWEQLVCDKDGSCRLAMGPQQQWQTADLPEDYEVLDNGPDKLCWSTERLRKHSRLRCSIETELRSRQQSVVRRLVGRLSGHAKDVWRLGSQLAEVDALATLAGTLPVVPACCMSSYNLCLFSRICLLLSDTRKSEAPRAALLKCSFASYRSGWQQLGVPAAVVYFNVA